MMTSPTASSPPGFFDIADKFGTWRLIRFAAALVAFLGLQLVRLVLLFVLHIVEGLMKRIDATGTAAVMPAPPKPPPDTRDTPAPTPRGEDLVHAA